MSLRDVTFSSLYRKKDDVLNNFYIPALSNSKSYKRVSAYFSADVLKLYSTGLSSFVNGNGKIQFIFSHHITMEDYEQIKLGYDGRYNDELLKSISDLEDSIQISNLAYLISKGIVEIKIGFVAPGTLHFKYGLFEDGENIVCFRGSTNETPAGLLLNGENFEVSCSWLCAEHELNTINGYESDFDDLWKNNYEGVETVDAPKCVIDKIESYSKNALILDYEDQCTNSFIFDFDGSMRLVGYSFLQNKETLSQNSIWFKTRIKYAVDKIDNFGTFHFNDIHPSEIKILIKTFETYAQTNGFSVIVSNKVKNYLSNLDLFLEKRISVGNAIKNRDAEVLPEFLKFKEVVTRELSRTLKEPQLWDAFHAESMIAASNFSVPGTGKTTIAYGAFGFLSSKENDYKIKRIVMIGPKNSFMAWKNEFVLCFGNKRQLRCFNIQDSIYKNTNQKIAALYRQFDNSNLILINYDMLQNFEVLESLKSLMKKDGFSDYLILDEAHKIKGFEGKRANAVLSIAPFAKYKLILTGTPIPNSYLDIFNMLNILYGNNYDNFFGFTPQYLSQASYIPSRQEEINKKIYPFFCRTTKKDLKIPVATFDYSTGSVKMNEDERKLFNMVYNYFGYNTLVLYIRLLQASINPASLLLKLKDNDVLSIFGGIDDGDNDPFATDNEDTDIEYLKKTLKTTEKGHSATLSPEDILFLQNFGLTRKFYKGIDIIESLVKQGKSVVAWGVFVDTLNSIHDELSRLGIKSVVISGSMPLEDRELNIDKFINGEFDVLISNPHTLAESVSLHKTCHDAVYFEYTFNLTHMLQSRDRIHRLGLPDGTKTTYYFVSIDGDDFACNSIDLKTLERLKMKEDRMLKAVESKQLFIKSDSFKDDIDFIFGKKDSEKLDK